MRFFVYFPGRQAGNEELLREVGLGDLIGFGSPTPHWSPQLRGGPDGGAGVIAHWPHPEVHWRGNRDSILWSQVPGRDHWLGFDQEHPPTPGDLARDEQQLGTFVRLDDGNEWLIPQARQIDRRKVLRNGKIERLPIERLRGFWSRAWDEVLPAMLGEEGKTLTTEGAESFAAEALAINYAVSAEAGLLCGLWSDGSVAKVVRAALSLDEILAAFQKKTSDRPE